MDNEEWIIPNLGFFSETEVTEPGLQTDCFFMTMDNRDNSMNKRIAALWKFLTYDIWRITEDEVTRNDLFRIQYHQDDLSLHQPLHQRPDSKQKPRR